MPEEFTTLKVPLRVKRMLRAYKGKLIQARKEKVSDAQAITALLRSVNQVSGQPVSGKSVWDYAGFAKGGPRFNSVKEMDKVVYGV